jgi:fumarate hydratase subunit beta
LKIDEIEKLRVGELLQYTGDLIVMRDAGHQRLLELVSENLQIPVDLNEKIVFYAGPANPPKNSKIGVIGPTTSERMDKYLEMIFKLGVLATVGKGKRSDLAVKLCIKYKRVYFITPSGAAAYLSKCVKDIRVLAFAELGPEAIYNINVKDFPLMVAIDTNGDQIF